MIKYNKFENGEWKALNDGECCSSREFPSKKCSKMLILKRFMKI
jgi:hypothetical protein